MENETHDDGFLFIDDETSYIYPNNNILKVQTIIKYLYYKNIFYIK